MLKEKLGKGQIVSVTTDDTDSTLGGRFDIKLPTGSLTSLKNKNTLLELIEYVSGNPKSLFAHKAPLVVLGGYSSSANDAGKLCGG